MDEYEASCMRIEKISTAIQSIKESLTCRICLELFDEPVTIKCGHKFCRNCILRVTNNENSSCPFCNTKIQKRSIPKEGNAVFQASVKHFENLIKAIQIDTGIDVSQPYNKAKNTKESSVEYSKSSISKVEDTPSTSKGSPMTLNQKLTKTKVTNPVKSRLSLTKKKTDAKSPSQNSVKHTLLNYYTSNKSDPVPDQVVHSQEKVKNWLESCTSEDNDNRARDSIPGPSNPVKDICTTDQIGIDPPDQIDSGLQNNEIKKCHVSPAPLNEENSDSKFRETHMRIQEAEMMAKKKIMSLSVKENNNVKTPSSVPATSQSDACNWRRVKQVGREMQVKTFKTLNVSIEKCSPSVVVDDTVLYNSTNNESKNISHDSEANNTSADKTPLQSRKCQPLESENNNLLKKSPQIVIEDYKHRSMDSTASPKEECAYDVDQNQLNEIIGIVPSTSVLKTPEKTKPSLKRVKTSNFNSKLNQLSASMCITSDQVLLNDESSNCDSKTTVQNLQSSPSKKNILSLKSLKNSINSKTSSPSGSNSDKTNEKEKESDNNILEQKSNCRILLGSLNENTSSIEHKIALTKLSLNNDLVNKQSTSVSRSCRVIFQKLGKICKKSKNVPFRYLGKLEKEKCVFFNANSCRKPSIVVKSNIPVCIDYKSLIDDKNIANLEDFLSDELPLKSPTISSTVNNHGEPMNIDNEVNIQKPDQSYQQMEIDETLLPAKMVVKNNSNLERRNSELQIQIQEEAKLLSLRNKDFQTIQPQLDVNVPSRNIDEDKMSIEYKTKIEKWDPIPKSSIKEDIAKNPSNIVQEKLSSMNKSLETDNLHRIPDDLISISSDDCEIKIHRKSSTQNQGKAKLNMKSDVESCKESDVSVASERGNRKNVEDVKQEYASTSSSSLKTKKKRTHSESSNDPDDDLNVIIGKWTKKTKISLDAEKEQVTKKPKITVDSEEMLNRNASKRRNRSRYSITSSSDDEEETFKENKHQQNLLFNETSSKVKDQIVDINTNKLSAMPSSMLSADLFESNEQSIQPKQSLQKQSSEIAIKINSAIDFDTQSDKENISERSPDNITVIDTRQLKKRKSTASRSVDNDKENSECNLTFEYNKSIKSTQETADEIENSQKRRKSITTKVPENSDKKNNEHKRLPDFNKSIKTAEDLADDIENSQTDKNKITDNLEHESNPYFVRESLLNITQEQIACKKIEKDLFGVDLSKIHENQNEDPLDYNKLSTPRRKPTNFEENDEFDTDNIAATPVVKRRHTFRLPSSQSSPQSEINTSNMPSPIKKNALIPAITPMKNTKSYPLSHSTPMITMDSPESRIHSQIESIKLICTSLSPENTKLVQKFANKFNAQFQMNFDMDVTHVIVKVDPQTKAGPKTFKYIQGIAFKKYVVSFEWITDCLDKNKLLDVNDEKYDVLDPEILESGCKKSRLSSQKLFKNFVFCCLEPFEKVSLSEFEELLTFNGAVIVSSIREFHLYKDRLKIIIVGTEDLDEEGIAILSKAEAAAVYFEWVVDSLSQFQILSLPSYLCETTVEKVRSLGFPPELLVEEETLDEYEDDN